jgi:hypothetical protein
LIGSQDAVYRGVATGTDLIALKVFEDSGKGYFSYLEKALQWVIANQEAYHIGVVNLSLGDTGNWTDTFSLNATPAHWPVQLLPLSVTLSAHSDTFANVIVSVPLTATAQLTDVVRVTVTGTGVSDFSELITRAMYAYQVHLPLILK